MNLKQNKTCILFVSDKKKYNFRYRAVLIKKFQKLYDVRVYGLIENIIDFLTTFTFCLFSKNTLIISSNLKSNLIILLIFWRKKVLIINGLGRFRKRKFLRVFFIILLKCQLRQNLIFFQNYADFRFFRKNSPNSLKIFWMPGSGGVKRKLGADGSNVSVITRDEKVPTQIKSIEDLYQNHTFSKSLLFVGIADQSLIKLGVIKFRSVGYVNQDEILSFSKNLLVPNGYGEGVPHTLVDAIMSDASVYMSKQNYVQFGFYKYTGCDKLGDENNWIKLKVNQDLKELVAAKNIVEMFYQKVNSFM